MMWNRLVTVTIKATGEIVGTMPLDGCPDYDSQYARRFVEKLAIERGMKASDLRFETEFVKPGA